MVRSIGTLKVIALACACIAAAVFIMVGMSYSITQKAVVARLQSQDLVFIVQSITAKIDGRIARAEETAELMARDPSIQAWTLDMEQDKRLGELVLQKIADIAQAVDYSNSFIVSNLTKHYWTESGRMIDTMAESDPDDAWFFETLAAQQPVSISIDYNKEREDTYVFVNALMGAPTQPIGVTGVGLSLKGIAQEIANYKFGERSNLWLIDAQGKVHLTKDLGDRGKSIAELLPTHVAEKIIHNTAQHSSYGVMAYNDTNGELMDLIHQPMQATDWQLVLQIPRTENTGFLNSIRVNLLIAAGISLVLIAVLFYFVSTRIANPFQQALIINKELEGQVELRTLELREKNDRIMDSIEYAKRLQETVIPADDELQQVFKDYFVLWRPRDIVGGDFYWSKKVGGYTVLVVADCTGHGVPGALMTMASTAILNHVVDLHNCHDPAAILKGLHLRLHESLHKNRGDRTTDDGIDIGICAFSGTKLVFAGAKTNLYIRTPQGVEMVRGERHSVGYHRLRDQVSFTNTTIALDPNTCFYMTTDGLLDQNGGERDLPFGRRRFLRQLESSGGQAMQAQKRLLEEALGEYMADNEQRDDILAIGFRL
ncbi:MAG: SpoIIE family protein phosphatase [Bacillota bacterium]